MPGTPSISAGWMPWKWIVCGCSEPLPNRIRSRSPSRARSVGRRDAAVVGPGRELDARRDLDLLVDRDQLPLAQRRGRWRAAGCGRGRSRAAARSGRSRLRRGRRARRPGSPGGRAPIRARAARRRRARRARACSCARGGRRAEVHAAQPRHGAGPQGGGECGEHASAAEAVHGRADYGMPKSWFKYDRWPRPAGSAAGELSLAAAAGACSRPRTACRRGSAPPCPPDSSR